ncbi:NPR1/NH1-interacting protein [Abeliophyllum distichum]|uniref:NPR1/NH1-interacting protein n=1 Tax=Abeliophyllum distichum TaxID=126358 RepID=A0ABD1RTW0_9LAMI
MEDEENDEEKKMELFFALIKSTRQVHEKLMKRDQKGIEKPNEYKPPVAAVWNPCFRPEDFMEDAVQPTAAVGCSGTSTPLTPPTAPCEREDKESKSLMEEEQPPAEPSKGRDSGLDLNLSL